MAQQVVTELVIDANTSGADQFSQAMDRSADSAQKGANSIQSYTLAVAGVGLGIVGAMASLRSFIDYVGQQTQQLVDLASSAELAGMSVKEFQQSLYAARAGGLSDKDFFSGMDKIASDLAQASEKTTEFGELFKQNGIAIKNANGELISTKQALTDIMGLMQNASPVVQQRIAQIAGLSASWIPFLKEGADQFEQMKIKASELGILIDDNTIQKAKEFNSQWKQAVAAWDLQFKASLAEILPLLIQLAQYALKILDSISGVYNFFSGLLTPDIEKSTTQLNNTINKVHELTEIMQSGGAQSFRATTLKGALGLPEDADLDQVMAYQEKVQKLYDDKVNRPDRIRVTPEYTTVLPNMAGKDDVARTEDAIERQIAKLKAEAEAAGAGAGEMAKLRAEAQLYAAAERAGIADTEKYADRFYDLAERAGQAATALAKAQVNAQIRFDSRTAFLSQEDVQIASKLKDIYPDVATALNSAEAAQMRFNNASRQLSTSIENDLTSGLTDFVSGTKNASQAFGDMAKSILTDIEKIAIRALIVQPLMKSFGLSILPSEHGNVFSGGNIIPFAQGGVVDSPTIAPMALFGEAGPEAIMPLRRGPDGNLGVASAGGGQRTENHNYYINAPGADQGTIQQLKVAVGQLGKAIKIQGESTRSARRFEATGVG